MLRAAFHWGLICMTDRGSRFEIECPYCLQPFRMPPNSQLHTVVCPFCGYRQFGLGREGELFRTGNVQQSGAVFPGQNEVLVGSFGSGEALLGYPGTALPGISRTVEQDLAVPHRADAIGWLSGEQVAAGRSDGIPPGQPAIGSSTEEAGRWGEKEGEGTEQPGATPAAVTADTRVSEVTLAPTPTHSLGNLPLKRRRDWAVGVAVGIAGAMVVSFLSGLWVGRYVWSDSRGSPYQRGHRGRISGGVLVEGRLTYRPDPLSGRPDAGAAVILLPADRTPSQTIPVAGLRVHEALRPNSPGYRAVTELGGAVERTGAGGEFMVVVAPGTYYVLLISRSAQRPAGEPIRPSDLAEMRKYFYAAEDLIGPSKYHWAQYRFTEAEHSLDYNFGLDERDQNFDPLRDLTQ
jgi:hypothetical protein